MFYIINMIAYYDSLLIKQGKDYTIGKGDYFLFGKGQY